MYLGDGCLRRTRAGAYQAAHLARRSLSRDRRGMRARDPRGDAQAPSRERRASGSGTTLFSLYSKHLACLFPQHGPGTKHEREIVLTDWQTEILVRAGQAAATRPDPVRWLSFENTRTGPWSHLSLLLQQSTQRRHPGTFLEACDLVGVEYRRTRGTYGSTDVERRAHAAHVGMRRDHTLGLPPSGCRETGIRAVFRWPWANAREGSNPLSRIEKPLCGAFRSGLLNRAGRP